MNEKTSRVRCDLFERETSRYRDKSRPSSWLQCCKSSLTTAYLGELLVDSYLSMKPPTSSRQSPSCRASQQSSPLISNQGITKRSHDRRGPGRNPTWPREKSSEPETMSMAIQSGHILVAGLLLVLKPGRRPSHGFGPSTTLVPEASDGRHETGQVLFCTALLVPISVLSLHFLRS